MMVFGGGTFGRLLGHQDRDLINGMKAMKGTERPLWATWEYKEKLPVCNLEDGSHQNSTRLASTLMLLPTSRTVRNVFVSHPVYGILLYQPELGHGLFLWELSQIFLIWSLEKYT